MVRGECRFAERWADIWASLTPEEGRTLSQVLAGKRLVGVEPTHAETAALAEYMTRRIDAAEYGHRVSRARAH